MNHNTTHPPRKRVSFDSIHEYLPVSLPWFSGDELEPDGPVPFIRPENRKALEIPVFFENIIASANARPHVIIEFRSRIVQDAFDQFKGLVHVARFPERETIRRRPLSQLHYFRRGISFPDSAASSRASWPAAVDHTPRPAPQPLAPSGEARCYGAASPHAFLVLGH